MNLFTHLLKKNRFNPKRAEDLIFFRTNLRLLSRKRSGNTYNEEQKKKGYC
jgi:hypothetical protein